MSDSRLYEAATYDRGMWLLEKSIMANLRRRLISEARGDVLEIGAGTGANARFYSAGATVAAIDLRPAQLLAAADKARRHGLGSRFDVACADARWLPFGDDAFDMVIGTLVFCSIADPAAALAEIQRVLRPGGRLFLLEHVRGRTPLARKLTDALHPLWFALQGVCHLNRDTADTVAAAGFRLDSVTDHTRGLVQLIHATAPGR